MRRNQAVQAAFDLGPARDGPARFVAMEFGLTEREIMAETAKTAKPRKAAAKASSTKNGGTAVAATSAAATPTKRDEAKSRFNAALEEARAGAALLGAEARERAGAYGVQARERGDDWTAEAKTKATELAYEGKAKASEALVELGRLVGDNAGTIDEKLGSQYGDYARSASRVAAEHRGEARAEERRADRRGRARIRPQEPGRGCRPRGARWLPAPRIFRR